MTIGEGLISPKESKEEQVQAEVKKQSLLYSK